MEVQVCPGCGSRLDPVEGTTHAYMTSSPACWSAFNQVLEREYSNPALMEIHSLTVDTWAVQHPGDGSRRAIQSVGLHLARMLVQLEQGLSGKAAYAAMANFAARKTELPELPPRAAYSMTVADVADAVESEDHISAIHRWAETTWRDWSDQHDFIRDWVRGVSSKE